MKTCCSEAGLISIKDFEAAIKWFAEKSSLLEDGWQLHEYKDQYGLGSVMLKKFSCILLKLHSRNMDNLISSSQNISADDSDIDEGEMAYTSSPDSMPVACQMEHHVLYSYSYCVPVLYFNVYTPGGELVSLEELWSNVTSQVNVRENLWTVITQQEHPLSHRPFFHLHPCHTADLLREIHPDCCNKFSKKISLESDSLSSCFTSSEKLLLLNGSHDLTDTEQMTCSYSISSESASVPSSSTEIQNDAEDLRTRLDGCRIDSQRSYLISWLSTAAPLVFLQLSYKYADYRSGDKEVMRQELPVACLQ